MQMDRQKMKVKICLVGEGAVGKTCLIRRFIQDQFDDRYISTLGAKVSKKEIKLDESSDEAGLADRAFPDEADLHLHFLAVHLHPLVGPDAPQSSGYKGVA